MRIRILIVLLLCSYCCFAQKGGVVINRPLTWNDFKGKSIDGSSVKARTYTYMGYQSRVKNGKFSYKITCYFIPGQSWVSRGYLKRCTKAESAYLLKHEQVHYDIAKVIAVEANRELARIKGNDKRAMNKARSVFSRYVKKLKSVQERYDRDTRHSLNNAAQKRWNAKIQQATKSGRIEA